MEEEELERWGEILAMIRGTHPRCNGEPQYLIGIQPGYGPRYVPARDMYHVLVTGLTGAGKSVFLLSQILQDVLRGNTVFVFDPHGDLAERLLTHIPRERWGDVVYVNPLTARDFGRVVRYNFLEVREGQLPSIVKRSFMDALQKNYPEFWGPRLDAIIDHAISLLQKTPGIVPTLPRLGRVLAKETYREALLAECRDESVCDFWHSTFPNYRDDAITAAQNKLYRVLEEEIVTPITGAERSTVDFGALMQEGKIVVFDIREGVLTSSLSSFIGTLFLARIYQAGMAREQVPPEERRYVRVYVDEASRFLTGVLKDNMQALRKYNVFLTVVCQNLDQFSEGVRVGGGISQYTSTVVAFQSSHETAKSLEGFFLKLPELPQPSSRHDHLERTKFYHFYISTIVGAKRENYYVRAIDPGVGGNRPEDVIRHSLDRYGERYDFQEMRPVLKLPDIEFGPAAYFALSELEQRGEIHEEDLIRKLGKFAPVAVKDALFKTLQARGWAACEAKKGPTGSKLRYWRITDAGREVLYPTTSVWGNRLGGKRHIAMLCLACKLYREEGFYPMMISGRQESEAVAVTVQEGEKSVDMYPDIVLVPPYAQSFTKYSPSSWDLSRAVAVEVEAYPRGGKHTGSHLDRTRAHFVKARDMLEMPVIFVVATEADAAAVREEIRREGAHVVADVHARYAPGNASVRVLHEQMLEKAEDGSVDASLARQIRMLAEMSHQADISEVAEPEDFAGDKVPDYASRRWYEERRRLEAEAEKKIKEEGKKEGEDETKRVKPQPSAERRVPEIQPLPIPEKEGAKSPEVGSKESGRTGSEEEELRVLKRQRVEFLKKGGWVFWREEAEGGPCPLLRAGKAAGGGFQEITVDFLDDVMGEVLSELGITPEPRRPDHIKREPETPEKIAHKLPGEKAKESPETVSGRQKAEARTAPAQPSPTVENQPQKPQADGDFESWLAELKKRDIVSQIAELKKLGARLRKKVKGGREYATARIWLGGKRKEISLGPYDEMQQTLREKGIFI